MKLKETQLIELNRILNKLNLLKKNRMILDFNFSRFEIKKYGTILIDFHIESEPTIDPMLVEMRKTWKI